MAENKKSRIQKAEEYQDEPDYRGMEDGTPVGKKAAAAADKAGAESELKLGAKAFRNPTEKQLPGWGAMVNKAAVKAAKEVIAKDREQRKSYENTNPAGDTFKKGGKVSSASKRADGCAQRGKTRGKMV